MASIEERLQVLEQEHTQLKKTIELQTIAIRALVAKEAFEKLQETVEQTQKTIETSQEQNGKLFDTLIMHDRLTNEQLVELRSQQAALNGKLDRIQTETRQQLTELDGKIVGQQTEMRQRFNQVETRLNKIEETMATKEEMKAMENRILQAIVRTQRPQPE